MFCRLRCPSRFCDVGVLCTGMLSRATVCYYTVAIRENQNPPSFRVCIRGSTLDIVEAGKNVEWYEPKPASDHDVRVYSADRAVIHFPSSATLLCRALPQTDPPDSRRRCRVHRTRPARFSVCSTGGSKRPQLGRRWCTAILRFAVLASLTRHDFLTP